jgi:hypothetical protein
MANKNTIILKKYVDIYEEYTATAVAVLPGTVLEVTSAGLVQAHSGAGEQTARLFAVEDALQGKEVGDEIAASGKVQVAVFVPGEIVNARIAANAVVTVGAPLTVNGSGALTPTIVAGDIIVGHALRAIDMTDPDEAEYGLTAVRIV